MKGIRTIFALILMLPGISSLAGDTLLLSAEQAYREGRYDAAARTWAQALQDGYNSADIHYNLGNALFKSDDLPRAILEWERALRLDPRHADARYNIELANTLLDDKITPLPGFFLVNWYEALVALLPYPAWAWTSFGLMVVASLVLLAFRLMKGPGLRRWSFYMAAALFLAALLTLLFSWQARRMAHDDRQAIIFSPTVIVKSSPDERGTDLFVIHAGTKVEITDGLQEWYRIRIADGNDGWVPEGVLERIQNPEGF